MVVSSAALRSVWPHWLLRLLAGAAREPPCPRAASPLDPVLRAGARTGTTTSRISRPTRAPHWQRRGTILSTKPSRARLAACPATGSSCSIDRAARADSEMPPARADARRCRKSLDRTGVLRDCAWPSGKSAASNMLWAPRTSRWQVLEDRSYSPSNQLGSIAFVASISASRWPKRYSSSSHRPPPRWAISSASAT
jgi:hypothetical protein